MPLLDNTLIKEMVEKILLRVQKPGRYVGGELNQVVKPWEQISTKVALVFPDIYDIGVSNLGLAILYEELNDLPDVLAERAYLPWLDMEDLMRQDNIPLFSLESSHALADFDVIGISIPYENLNTNTLNLLDLCCIPLYSRERNSNHPLIIAGGHSCYNPEPMADFIDAFVIGEGEGAMSEISGVYQAWKASGAPRGELFQALAGISGVYVPSLYEVAYNDDHTVKRIQPIHPSAPLQVNKRVCAKLPPPPTRLIVPTVDIVHNRVSVEIMRGCSRGCRFCHAGMINRPVRERPVEEVVRAVEAALDNTGFEEIALLSLSSSDYRRISELVQTLGEKFEDENLKISLPSLRIESFSIDLLEKLRDHRSGGFTLAPEAATERMRNIINKPITSSQLLETVHEIYSRGWLTIKLYFMIGHPSETLEDVREIVQLCKAVMAEGRRSLGRKASLHVGISTFVPKAHTPFQWVACDQKAQIEEKICLLKSELKGPGIKMNWTDPDETMFESWLSRGDRRMGSVIYYAWKNGAKFDAWQDHFNLSAWQQAFEQTGLEPYFYNHRQREIEETLPWDHIRIGVSKKFLAREYAKSQAGKLTEDCSQVCSACGILGIYGASRETSVDFDWKCPPLKEAQL
jgi:radical SAM family uncharacterized protein